MFFVGNSTYLATIRKRGSFKMKHLVLAMAILAASVFITASASAKEPTTLVQTSTVIAVPAQSTAEPAARCIYRTYSTTDRYYPYPTSTFRPWYIGYNYSQPLYYNYGYRNR
jgi:hypothetical protein